MARIVAFLVSLLFVSFVFSENPRYPPCNCQNKADCQPVESWNKEDREVMITTDGREGYQNWMWDSITTVLQLHDGYNPDLICYTHSKGRKYGFIREMISSNYSADKEVSKYTDTLKLDVKGHTADVLALDLLKILGNCHNAEKHVSQIVTVITKVINETKKEFPRLKILCVMPWKPPCYDKNCGITPSLVRYCDAVILNSESFDTYCPDDACRARATVPFTKLYIGLDEYLASGVDNSKMILGIPWHGYNYSCETFKDMSGSEFSSICTLKQQIGNITVCNETKQINTSCDIEGSRVKIPLGDYIQADQNLLMGKKKFSRPQQAPYLSGKDANNQTYHQLWYENYASLATKYSVVVHYNLKGCVIYTGDDLSNSQVESSKRLNTEMWSWLLHTILATSTHSFEKEESNVAGLVAGVGIGMFVFGCLLGTLIACIRFRQKGRLRPPFQKDFRPDHDDHDEYHDDDNTL